MKKIVFVIIFLGGLMFLLTSGLDYSGGSPGGKTGSPGDGTQNCTYCHTGAQPATVDGWITTNIPATGYIPGNTYSITLTGTHAGVSKFGFEATVEDSQSNKVGIFTITNPAETALTNVNHAVTHRSAGTTPSGNTKTWNFDWTAPATGTGEVTVYAAFNAANGNGMLTGDVIYLSTLAIPEGTGTDIDNETNENDILVFPVPFENHVVIRAASGLSSVTVYNAFGKPVKRIENQNSGEKELVLNTNNLKPGVYILVATGGNNQSFSKQIIKF